MFFLSWWTDLVFQLLVKICIKNDKLIILNEFNVLNFQ